ncbi:MAG: TetR/AcrR family transcriptional regulator [Peptococcaceae bacterium]|nr:TetR/AcrR family transcriptional regulator [Peptococcaceae bacterium]
MKVIPSKRELNKAKKKASLIDAAERLFIQKGFENTSIDEVAKEAGLTKRTLYQYFLSKEDLFYAVALKGARQLFSIYEDAMSKGDNALEKIRLGNKVHLQFYTDNLGMFRLLNYRPANQKNSEASPHYRELVVLDSIRMKYYMELSAECKSDGSINTNLDITKAVFFAFFSAFSLLYTVSSLNMWDKLELNENEFLRFSFDLLADAIKHR